jgi:hypothetical protein
VTRLVDSMPGFPGQPMSRADVERKFRSNVGKRWPQQTDAVLGALWALDRTDDLPFLLGTLSVHKTIKRRGLACGCRRAVSKQALRTFPRLYERATIQR